MSTPQSSYQNLVIKAGKEHLASVDFNRAEEANARLIASAPAMYEALQEALIGLVAAENNMAARIAETKIRAALKAATGD